MSNNLTLNMDDIEAGESTPLVSANNDDDEPLGAIQENTTKEKLIAAGAAVAAGTNIASMVVESNPAVIVSGAIGTVMAPYAALQQQKITETNAMKETVARLDEEVNILRSENDRLKATVGEIEESVERLQDMEETLVQIRKIEGQSLDELENQLKQTEEIFASMQGNLKSTVLQNLISVVLQCDHDGDMMLDDDEIDMVISKIQNLYGVNVKDELFKKKVIDAGRSLNGIMELGKNLMEEKDPKEKVFEVIDDEDAE